MRQLSRMSVECRIDLIVEIVMAFRFNEHQPHLSYNLPLPA